MSYNLEHLKEPNERNTLQIESLCSNWEDKSFRCGKQIDCESDVVPTHICNPHIHSHWLAGPGTTIIP